MLRFKLFKGAALLVIMFGLVSGTFGVRLLRSRVVNEAQNSVALDLVSAWSVYNQNLREIETIMRLAATKQALIDAAETDKWENADIRADLQNRLERIAAAFGLHFLTVVNPDGQSVIRATPPHRLGDYAPQDTIIVNALKGTTSSGTTLFTLDQLNEEAEGLAEKAFIALEETPRARPTTREAVTRGLVMLSAVPIEKNGRVLGAIYGGILLNRNADLVDLIDDTVFKRQAYKGRERGTVTIFLHDSRIATTVRRQNGNRAYGTRVSKEVADRVLDNGMKWVDRAFVVQDWYLTAYDPIRNAEGEIIGMLYVGTLEQPFRDLQTSVLMRYAALSGIGLVVALVLAFVLAGRIAYPLHRLAEAARQVRSGRYPDPVPVSRSTCRETTSLIHAFNEMAKALKQREDELKEANHSLTVANANYMETVQFVSHELKRPASSMMNYVYMLKEQLLGPLSEKQAKAARVLDANLRTLTEMIRHYLNLARIENNEMSPLFGKTALAEDVLKPILESLEPELNARNMTVVNDVPRDLACNADLNMVREVFENLLSNAVKYGRGEGRIEVKAEARDNMAVCHVWNEGPGIPREQMPKLFGKFARLGQEMHDQRDKGTGLGLFITRQIVEAHGGTIHVESEPGEWVDFCFTLPLWNDSNEENPRENEP